MGNTAHGPQRSAARGTTASRSNWRPISEAPKSGHWLMGQRRWADKWTGRMHYQTAKTFWSRDDGAWLRGTRIDNYRHWQPEWWQPLDGVRLPLLGDGDAKLSTTANTDETSDIHTK